MASMVVMSAVDFQAGTLSYRCKSLLKDNWLLCQPASLGDCGKQDALQPEIGRRCEHEINLCGFQSLRFWGSFLL